MPEYESNFYKAENIIGYTGDINNKPSVYFQNGNAIGHITQKYDNPNNIGRDPIISGPSCRLENSGPGGSLQEFADGVEHHTSRNPLVRTSNKADLDKLANSISEFPELKKLDVELVKFSKESAEKGLTSFFPRYKAIINYERQKIIKSRLEYEPNFYKAENIIGYTGDINNNPTVYFQDGNNTGHITQNYHKPNHLGKNLIISDPGVKLENNGPNGVLQESINGAIHKISRTPLVRTTDKAALNKLAKAIDNFPGLKPRDAVIKSGIQKAARAGDSSPNREDNAMINYEKQKLMQQFIKPQASFSEGTQASTSKKKKKKESKIKKSRFSFFKR